MGLQGDGKKMLSGLKSKLGFGSGSRDDAYEDYSDEGYDDYADDAYGDYGDYADDSRSAAGSAYQRYAPVTTRTTPPVAAPSSPRLVSRDDVRANTPLPYGSTADGLPSRSLGRTMVDSSLPPEMTPAGTAAASAAASRRSSAGLDSLFTPTTDAPGSSGASSLSAADSPIPGSSHDAVASAYGSGNVASGSSYAARRTLTVLKLQSYADAEGIAPVLKAGDVAVLSMHDIPSALSTRVLDFSFGVAYVLGASVECVGDGVFAIACGSALSDVERMSLRSKGVL